MDDKKVKSLIMLHLLIKYDIKCLDLYDIIRLFYNTPLILEDVIKMLQKVKVSPTNDTKQSK